MKDELGDRMKYYESLQEPILNKELPTFARVDGRAFSKFTKSMKRPYDEDMAACMQGTALALAKATNAKVVYTQSDEITLMWLKEHQNHEIWFDHRFSKMVSQTAALATFYFNFYCKRYFPDLLSKCPTFDCRIWQVPDLQTAQEVFQWRSEDAKKNSVTMAARSFFSDSEIFKKGTKEKIEMLASKGIKWEDYPEHFKHGTALFKCEEHYKFNEQSVLSNPKHNFHKGECDSFVRKAYKNVPLTEIKEIWT